MKRVHTHSYAQTHTHTLFRKNLPHIPNAFKDLFREYIEQHYSTSSITLNSNFGTYSSLYLMHILIYIYISFLYIVHC